MMVVASVSCGGAAVSAPDDEDIGFVPGPSAGVPAGPPVTAQIGPAGGTLQTADGGFTLAIPAGALSKATSITVQPMVNTSPSGIGLSYHVEPAGLKLGQPATLTVAVDQSELAGLPTDWVGIGLRDKSGVWYGDIKSTVTSSASTAPAAASFSRSSSSASQASMDRVVWRRTVSIDDEWAEYTLFAFWRVTPMEATVEVGGLVTLEVQACLRFEQTNGSDFDSDQLPALPQCRASIRQGTWRIASGSGTVNPIAGSNGAKAVYIAPNSVPSVNPVSVVPSMYWAARNVTKVFNNPPIKITVVGKELIGTASGTVASANAAIGPLYDYSAKITWTRTGSLAPGVPATYRPQGYVKLTARNRCVSQIRPDSIPLSSSDAELTISYEDSTWSVDGGAAGGMATVGYYDTCQKANSVLILVVPYIDGPDTHPLPVKGVVTYNQGLKVSASFNYAREGESASQSVAALGKADSGSLFAPRP
jgi:hypothetical protein